MGIRPRLQKIVNGRRVTLSRREERLLSASRQAERRIENNGDRAVDIALARVQFFQMFLDNLPGTSIVTALTIQQAMIDAVRGSGARPRLKDDTEAMVLWEQNFPFRDKRTQLLLREFAGLTERRDRRRLWRKGTLIPIADADTDA